MASTPFTATEQRLYTLLLDGMPHSREEVRDCVGDEYTEYMAVAKHVSKLRRKLPLGRDIVARNGHYRLVGCIVNS